MKPVSQSTEISVADKLKPVLEVDNLTTGYKKETIITDISFSVSPGEFTAVIGPNGCGKTTLIKSVLKSIKPRRGSIYIKGDDIQGFSNKDLSEHLAAVMQTIDPAAMTVRDYVLLGRLPFFTKYQFFETSEDIKIAEKYMELTDVIHLADAKVNEISGGERQLCAIAKALTQEPSLLVLDEPTSHLDITHQVRILDLINNLKKQLSLAVLMVLHDLNLAAEYADSLVLLDKDSGAVFSQGSPEKVLTSEAINTVYKTDVRVEPNPVSKKPWVFLVNKQDGGSV